MNVIWLALLLYGVAAVGAACFWLGRMSVGASRKTTATTELSLSEKDKKTLRELQNFLQYDGFSQP